MRFHINKKSYLVLLSFVIIIIFLSSTVNARKVHRVLPEENIYTISNNYGITMEEIISLNNLNNPDNIYNSQVLIIPDKDKPWTYRVKAGDSLYSISEKLRIPVDVLAEVNKLNKSELYVRQVLYIPYRFRYPQKYTVKSGDTLYKLSQKFKISINEITIINQINENINLEPGQTLQIHVLPEQKNNDNRNPQYTSKFPDTFFNKGNTNKKQIAITFDDGPDNIYTPQILDILKEYNVPATFFLMGSRAEKYPELVKRITKEGHLLANHSWSHADLSKINNQKLDQEVRRTENTIEEITGEQTALIRTPYGAYSSQLIQKLRNENYKVIHWSIDSRDWLDQDVDQILINTLPNVNNDAIILFHSAGGKNHSLSATVEVLPELINTLRMTGYEFVSLDILINSQAYKNK
ncbi:MAG: polysaccharide deacetylase family protein [Halothermotrichaceae bacterium]